MEQEFLTGKCPKCMQELRVPASLAEFSCMYCGARLTADELLTVEEFIDLTKGSYGGDIIRRLREAYNKKGGEAT